MLNKRNIILAVIKKWLWYLVPALIFALIKQSRLSKELLFVIILSPLDLIYIIAVSTLFYYLVPFNQSDFIEGQKFWKFYQSLPLVTLIPHPPHWLVKFMGLYEMYGQPIAFSALFCAQFKLIQLSIGPIFWLAMFRMSVAPCAAIILYSLGKIRVGLVLHWLSFAAAMKMLLISLKFISHPLNILIIFHSMIAVAGSILNTIDLTINYIVHFKAIQKFWENKGK